MKNQNYLLYILAFPTPSLFSCKFEVEFDRNNEPDDDNDDEMSRRFDEELEVFSDLIFKNSLDVDLNNLFFPISSFIKS